MDNKKCEEVAIHWFRHGLRLHDNPAFVEALKFSKELYCIFIFDNEVAGTKTAGYNRMRFLLESLQDIDNSLQKYGGRLYALHGKPVEVLAKLFTEWNVTVLTFEDDPEPIWQERDNAVRKLCHDKGIKCISKVSHTLWDPKEILLNNNNMAPLTFAQFNQVAGAVGVPPRPVEIPDYIKDVKMPVTNDFSNRFALPTLEKMGVEPEFEEQNKRVNKWKGGETKALELLEIRMISEEESYKRGIAMPNQYRPDLVGPPLSMSAHLRFGCLSVRKMYWQILDTFQRVCPDSTVTVSLTAQLIWREYFYTMSVDNIKYDQMKDNPICLQIPWYKDDEKLEKWTMGKTGFPWIDAAMNQMRFEGWIHHVARHAVSCFLTRGDLWISWEDGLKVFFKYLLDADWSVCAGNWMWVSSSAFEKVLQCPKCFCPVRYGRKMDPSGEYIRRYIPVLRDFPLKYLYEPWKAPRSIQEKAGCIIGKDYPYPMVEHMKASAECSHMMDQVRASLKNLEKPHCAPSSAEEVRDFVWLPDHHLGLGKGSTNAVCDGLESL